jgi:hypothetical protein
MNGADLPRTEVDDLKLTIARARSWSSAACQLRQQVLDGVHRDTGRPAVISPNRAERPRQDSKLRPAA